MKIIEVRRDEEMEEFIKLPFALYRDDPFFSPELLRDQREYFSASNPFFDHADVRFFIARRDGETAGRIASIVNHDHLRYWGERAGFFGFFESVNDPAAAEALLERVRTELLQAGMALMRGPMNFSTNEQCGFLIEGFQYPPMLMTPYNPPYYPELMQRYGMVKAKDLLAFIAGVPEALPGKIERAALMAEQRGIRVRRLEKRRLVEELRAFKEVYNEAWGRNWGFLPLTDDELEYMGRRLKPVISPEMTLIAEKDGEPVGFLGLVPDFNLVLRRMKGRLSPVSIIKALYYRSRIRDLRLLLLGVKASFRRRGVDALLFREGFKAVRGRYERVEFSWILEDNTPVLRLVDIIGARRYKRYRVYERPL